MAVPGWSAPSAVAQAPPPPTGLNFAAIVGAAGGRLDRLRRRLESKRISPGAIVAQLAAVNGPPDGAVLGQVWV